MPAHAPVQGRRGRQRRIVFVLVNVVFAVVVLGNLRSGREAIAQCRPGPIPGARHICVGLATSARNLDAIFGFGAWMAADLLGGMALVAMKRRDEARLVT